MSEELRFTAGGDRATVYSEITPQIAALLAGVADEIARMAHVAAVLKQSLGFFWVGFYRATRPGVLIAGPYQGDLACTEIPFAKGVCGAAARSGQTVIVADVDAFPGHISCSSLSRSEIVIPFVRDGATQFVLDVDSDRLDDFDDIDRVALERIVSLVGEREG